MRSRAFYRGERKYGWIITLVLFVLAVLILASIWLFYYLQKFIVYDKDGLKLVFPSEQTEQVPSAPGNSAIPLPGGVEVEIVVDKTDFSQVVTSAGEDLTPLRAVRISADKMNQTTLDYYLANTGSISALVMELKPETGFLTYRSSIPLTDSYGVNGTLELADTLEKLKNRDIYLVAEISALVDAAMAQRNAPIALKNAVSGDVYQSGGNMWLDPYSLTARDYIAALLQEAFDLGFDEVLLSGLYGPDGENVQFSQSMTQTPDLCSAVNSMALSLRRSAESIGIRLSAKMEGTALAAGTSAEIGQEADVFFRLFDRVAFDVSFTEYQAQLSTLEACAPAGADRIVPIGDGYAPDYADYIIN